jgi:heme/copper-type cytochrome/quinol oxidase subunit 2
MSEQPQIQLVNLSDATVIIFVFAAVTAVVGAFVAYQAYRGYQRNDSRPMLYLAGGIALITIVPFIVTYSIGVLATTTDAQTLLAITIANLAGVIAILYALTRA